MNLHAIENLTLRRTQIGNNSDSEDNCQNSDDSDDQETQNIYHPTGEVERSEEKQSGELGNVINNLLNISSKTDLITSRYAGSDYIMEFMTRVITKDAYNAGAYDDIIGIILGYLDDDGGF